MTKLIQISHSNKNMQEIEIKNNMIIEIHQGDTLFINTALSALNLQIINESDLNIVFEDKTQLRLNNVVKFLEGNSIIDELLTKLEFSQDFLLEEKYEIINYTDLLNALDDSAQGALLQQEYHSIEFGDNAIAKEKQVRENEKEDGKSHLRESDNDTTTVSTFGTITTIEQETKAANSVLETPIEQTPTEEVVPEEVVPEEVVPEATIIGSKKSEKIIGTSEDDIIDGKEGNDKIYGGDGNDTITGGAGRDTINAGDGDDKIIFDPNDKINGESGFDTIVFEEEVNFDFDDLVKNRIKNIEEIDLNETSNNTLTNIDYKDVLSITDENNTLYIKGRNGDVINLSDENSDTNNWVKTDEKIEKDGENYDVWTNNNAVLNIDEDIIITDI